MSRVSVIIPCYNHARYLSQAIASVLAQTRVAAEIIVIDDGSTDDTAQVAASFGEHIRYLYQPNAGLSAARNAGIRAGKGDYLGFLDADDLWRPDFLRVLVSLLDSDARLGAVYCGSRFVDANANPLSQVITRTVPAERLYDALIDGEFFPPCAVLVRRAVLEHVGLFDEALRASEDWDLWLRVAEQYPFAGTPQTLALYRMHGSNMTRDLEHIHRSQLQVLRKHFGPETGNPETWSGKKQRAFAGVALWQSLARYQRHENDAALQALRQAFIASPDLVKSLDTFYMLGCADQPPGYVGDLETLNLKQNRTNLLYALQTIFSDPTIPARLKTKRRTAYAMAFFALGVLGYRKRDLTAARDDLFRAVIQRPALLWNAQWLSTFAKSLLGVRLLETVVKWKHGLAGAGS